MQAKNKNFENYLCEKTDLIYNAAQELIAALMAVNTKGNSPRPEWNMENIGPIADAAEEILIANGLFCCHPYFDGDDRVMCYQTDGCTNPKCPFHHQ